MKCIVFVWVGMLVLTILCNTEIGQKGLGLIRGDTVLDFLYDKNIFIRIFTGIFYGGKETAFCRRKSTRIQVVTMSVKCGFWRKNTFFRKNEIYVKKHVDS